MVSGALGELRKVNVDLGIPRRFSEDLGVSRVFSGVSAVVLERLQGVL